MANTKKTFEEKKGRISASVTNKHKIEFNSKCELLNLTPSTVIEDLIIEFNKIN